MFCFTSVYAQWSTTHHEADQMKKMEAYDSYSYTNEVGDKFIFWSNSPKNFRIISSESIFNYNGNARWVNLEIGFYDENGNFIDKIVTMVEQTTMNLQDWRICRLPKGQRKLFHI